MTLVLLWGLATESPVLLVREALARQGVRTVLFDQRHILQTEVHLCVDGAVGGWMRTPDQRIDLAEVTGVYVRPFDTRHLPALRQEGRASAAWRHATAVEYTLWCWVEIAPGMVVNRPTTQASNGSKPYQSRCIQAAGFAVPDTLVTTDPAAARAFWDGHGTVVYKSVSSARSRVTRLRPEDSRRLADVAWCPTQFQEYIPGREYRVHVVGDEVFASEVICAADDYRYPGGQAVEVRAASLTADVARRCRRLARALRLPVAGIDLRRAPSGEWYCFEVNPSPGFAYYQRATGQPIGAAIAALLST